MPDPDVSATDYVIEPPPAEPTDTQAEPVLVPAEDYGIRPDDHPTTDPDWRDEK